jgi:hypothetical protein
MIPPPPIKRSRGDQEIPIMSASKTPAPMSAASFVRVGGAAGVLLAVTSLISVGEYFALVPQAQRLPVTDPGAYLTSLGQQPTGTLLFAGLYALIAFWAVIGIPAVYYRLSAAAESWAFFATLVGEIAAVGTLVTACAQLAGRLAWLPPCLRLLL